MQCTPERSGRSVIVVTVVIVLTDVVTRRCHKLAPSVRPFSGILSVMEIYQQLTPLMPFVVAINAVKHVLKTIGRLQSKMY